DQAGRSRVEDLRERRVDAVVDLGKHLWLDVRADLLAPDVGAPDGAEGRDREQEKGDERDECLKGDRARVREEAVLREQVDPEVDDVLEALPVAASATRRPRHRRMAFPRYAALRHAAR